MSETMYKQISKHIYIKEFVRTKMINDKFLKLIRSFEKLVLTN